MKRIALALLATAALGMPAMAASNMNQQTQQPPAQPPQSQAQNMQKPQAQTQNAQKLNTQKSSEQKSSSQNTKSSQAQPNNKGETAQNQSGGTIQSNKLSQGEVRQVQQALNKDGFKAGRADGRWGAETSNAVKQFQQSKNIQANGQLDKQTISDLGLNVAQFSPSQGSQSQQQ
jgi:peptidoglycan hydrolase-like protein with peptidoglycan-binding domain